ncbi:MAG TPA: ribosomal protein S18-alanine N-acetyltransferase [Candidatus Nanopelagicales bacterium]|nr:ribosomal protein S18-alanine N-acetyltransferase [Candidatus Nanopelagicales bacterium]
MTEGQALVGIDIEALTASAADLSEIDAMASTSLDQPQFSAHAELSRPWTRGWVAREERRVLAFLIAWHVADELHVLNVATAPAARRRGIAAALMRVSIDYAREHRIRILLLEVRRSNVPALRLYRGLGFTTLRVRSGYYEDNGEDAVEMILALDPVTGAIQPGRDEVRLDF